MLNTRVIIQLLGLDYRIVHSTALISGQADIRECEHSSKSEERVWKSQIR